MQRLDITCMTMFKQNLLHFQRDKKDTFEVISAVVSEFLAEKEALVVKPEAYDPLGLTT